MNIFETPPVRPSRVFAAFATLCSFVAAILFGVAMTVMLGTMRP